MDSSSDLPSNVKRNRKRNFTSQETVILIKEVSARRKLLLSQDKTSRTNKEKMKAWTEVMRKVNAVSPEERSAAELRYKWKQLTRSARVQLRGGKQPPPGGASKKGDIPEIDPELIRGMSSSDTTPASAPTDPHQELEASSETLDLSVEEEEPASEPCTVVGAIMADDNGILRLAQPLSGSTPRISTETPQSQPAFAQSIGSIPDTESGQTAESNRPGAAADQDCVNSKKRRYVSDAELRELERDRKEFEKQKAKAALRVLELEIEKQQMEVMRMQADLKHAAEIRELEKEKLKLEIQLLMKKNGEDGF